MLLAQPAERLLHDAVVGEVLAADRVLGRGNAEEDAPPEGRVRRPARLPGRAARRPISGRRRAWMRSRAPRPRRGPRRRAGSGRRARADVPGRDAAWPGCGGDGVGGEMGGGSRWQYKERRKGLGTAVAALVRRPAGFDRSDAPCSDPVYHDVAAPCITGRVGRASRTVGQEDGRLSHDGAFRMRFGPLRTSLFAIFAAACGSPSAPILLPFRSAPTSPSSAPVSGTVPAARRWPTPSRSCAATGSSVPARPASVSCRRTPAW